MQRKLREVVGTLSASRIVNLNSTLTNKHSLWIERRRQLEAWLFAESQMSEQAMGLKGTAQAKD